MILCVDQVCGRAVGVLLNILIILSAIVVISAAAVFQNYIAPLIGYDLYEALFVYTATIVLGVVGAVLAILGCAAIIVKDRTFAVTYTVALVLLIAVETAIAAIGFKLIDYKPYDIFGMTVLERHLHNYMYDHMQNDRYKKSDEVVAIVNYIQINWECCGIIEAADAWNFTGGGGDDVDLPKSCCDKIFVDYDYACKMNVSWKKGCLEPFNATLEHTLKVMLFGLLTSAAIQGFIVLFVNALFFAYDRCCRIINCMFYFND